MQESQIETIIEKIFNNYNNVTTNGKVADYIPALADIDPNHYAISVTTVNGNTYNIGDQIGRAHV